MGVFSYSGFAVEGVFNKVCFVVKLGIMCEGLLCVRGVCGWDVVSYAIFCG